MINLNGITMIKLLLKIILSITLLLNLIGCNSVAVKPNNNNSDTNTSNVQTENIDVLTLRQKADDAYQNNDLNNSAIFYEELIKKVPEEPLHWFRLANVYVRTNRQREAIDLYRETLIRDPKFSKAWYNLSIIQLKQTAYNLNEMLVYTDKNDPLYEKAANLLNGIQDIIQTE